MARVLALLLLAAAASAHGGSARTQTGPNGAPVPVTVFGEGTRSRDGTPKGAPTTAGDRGRRHTWEIWWSYHRDYYLALRVRGAAVTGLRARDARGRGRARQGLHDSMPNVVRAMAVCALGALADPRPVPVSALLVRNYNFIRCLALDEIASYL